MFWLGYVLGLATPFAVFAIAATVQWAAKPGWGQEGCYVCSHGPTAEIGQHRWITMWLWARWHRVAWSYRKWHREAWNVHRWNPENRSR